MVIGDEQRPASQPGIPIEKLEVVIEFNTISDEVWRVVKRWPVFELDTVGKQLVRAIDSVAANIVEGGLRESDLEAVRHFVIAKASAGEASNWLQRVEVRCIEPEEVIAPLVHRIKEATKRLERLIQFRRARASKRKSSS